MNDQKLEKSKCYPYRARVLEVESAWRLMLKIKEIKR